MTKLVTLKVEELGTVKAIYNDTICDIKIGNYVNVFTEDKRLDGVIMNIKEIDKLYRPAQKQTGNGINDLCKLIKA